jgi:hypothetical protein
MSACKKILTKLQLCSDNIKITDNQRLPGACNRSPGSKLLSITTQLHCIDYPNLEEFNKETRFVREKKEEISLH